MIITLSIEEIKRVVANKLALDVADFRLVIARNRKKKVKATPAATPSNDSNTVGTMLDKLLDRMMDAGVFDISGYNILPIKKIHAIKCIRFFYADHGYRCELKSGKIIAENFDEYLRQSKQHGFCTAPDEWAADLGK